ncbi:Protein red1 [Cyphellophora attinorum]|uniref:Protein red1 n=1 Tax=Cyphellophora attinorum TaxID=1664694 RepID=A0A0N1P2E8_9EURO|nr:Protein red1 [Phialophora attinorum]KPI42273.1 Protein red1 [Phialophora attinorum]
MSQPYQHQPAPGYNGSYGNATTHLNRRMVKDKPTVHRHSHSSVVSHLLRLFKQSLAQAQAQVPPPAPSFPFSTAPFPPDMLKQFAGANIPLPPPGFPPVPPPSLGFPPFPPLPQVQQTQPRPYSPSQQVRSEEGDDAYDPRYPQGIPQNVPQAALGRTTSNLASHNSQAPSQAQVQASPHSNVGGEPRYRADIAQLLPNLDGSFLSIQRHPEPPQPTSRFPQDITMGNTISKLSEEEETSASVVPSDAKPKSQSAPEHLSAVARHDDAHAAASSSGADKSTAYYDTMDAAELREAAKTAFELGTGTGPPVATNDNEGTKSPSAEPVTKGHPTSAVIAPTNSTASPSLERKDRIAQLLAARVSKSGPSPLASAEVQQSDADAAAKPLLNGGAVTDAATPSTKNVNTSDKPSVDQLETERPESAHAFVQPRSVSTLPGLGMMSTDSDVEDTVTSSKRHLDNGDALQNGTRKRRNTGSSSREDTEMEIDDSSQSASEGEVVESPRIAQISPPKSDIAVDSAVGEIKTTTPPAKTFSPIGGAKLTREEIAEKARQLKAQFLQKRARQQAAQEGLARSDSEVKESEKALSEQRSRLREVRQHISKMEADLEVSRKEEDDLLAKIRRSEEVLEQTLARQKDIKESLQSLKVQQNATTTAQSETKTTPEVDAAAQVQVQQDGPTTIVGDATLRTEPRFSDVAPENEPITDIGPVEELAQPAPTSPVSNQNEDVESDSYEPHAPNDDPLGNERGEPDVDNVMAPDEASNDERSQSPRPVSEGDVHENAHSDGSASMLDSASEGSRDEGEYSAAEEDDFTQPMELDNDSDEYEPTEAPVDTGNASVPVEEDSQPLQVNTVENGEADEADTAKDHAASANSDQPHASQKLDEGGQGGPSATAESRQRNGMDYNYPRNARSAPARPNGRWGQQRPTLEPLGAKAGVNKSASFSAYQSPLTAFPSFRYSESFSESAKDGYRSLTYSNTIDPGKPLCRTELAGDTCQDPQCEDQHFRHLRMSDDKILASMSSAAEFTDQAVRDRYLMGLKGVIADLRARNVRDFEDVAGALSEYRRKFVAGES